jgi:hypothetical protein
MALFDQNNELRCEKCGLNVFIERPMFVYTKGKGRIKDIITRENVGTVLECTNPMCRNIIYKENSNFFANAEIVDKS